MTTNTLNSFSSNKTEVFCCRGGARREKQRFRRQERFKSNRQTAEGRRGREGCVVFAQSMKPSGRRAAAGGAEEIIAHRRFSLAGNQQRRVNYSANNKDNNTNSTINNNNNNNNNRRLSGAPHSALAQISVNLKKDSFSTRDRDPIG